VREYVRRHAIIEYATLKYKRYRRSSALHEILSLYRASGHNIPLRNKFSSSVRKSWCSGLTIKSAPDFVIRSRSRSYLSIRHIKSVLSYILLTILLQDQLYWLSIATLDHSERGQTRQRNWIYRFNNFILSDLSLLLSHAKMAISSGRLWDFSSWNLAIGGRRIRLAK
jgi:hypothetical protein